MFVFLSTQRHYSVELLLIVVVNGFYHLAHMLPKQVCPTFLNSSYNKYKYIRDSSFGDVQKDHFGSQNNNRTMNCRQT